MKSLFALLLLLFLVSESAYSQNDDYDNGSEEQAQPQQQPEQQDDYDSGSEEQAQPEQQIEEPQIEQQQQQQIKEPQIEQQQQQQIEQPNEQIIEQQQVEQGPIPPDQSGIDPSQSDIETNNIIENPSAISQDPVSEESQYEMQDVTTWDTQQIEEVISTGELKELLTSDPENLDETIDDLSQKQLQVLEELPVEKLAEVLNIPVEEAGVLQQKISSNTEPVKQTYQFTEEISNEKVREISVLKDNALSEAINILPEEQIEELVKLPPDKLSIILNISIPEATALSEKISSGIVIPYDKTPIEIPEAMNEFPGVKETVGILNYILTAGLDMTPLQRNKSQKIVIIVILCTLLPYLFKKNNT